VATDRTGEAGQSAVLSGSDCSAGDPATGHAPIESARVRLPLITNAAYTGLVAPSEPVVEPGDDVTEGEVIAAPGEGISNTQHASIDGTIAEITDTHVVIER
jgi:Na+-translocating ferredoxin:NAD+ oxidoreductase RnfC subunit